MKSATLAGVVLTGLLAAANAAADPAPGVWYAAVDLGGHARQDAQAPAEFSELGAEPAAPRFHTDKDFAGFARVGYAFSHPIQFGRYAFSPTVRLELEGGGRIAEMLSIVDEHQNARPPGSMTSICSDAPLPPGAPPSCGRPPGSVNGWTLMGNVRLDYWPASRLHPFVGAGLGVARVRLQTTGALFGPTGPLVPPSLIVINDADSRVAEQSVGGLAMRITDRLGADLSYRFLFSGKHHWDTTTSGPIQLGTITGKYEDHALTLGFRYVMR